jgi:glycosyltransferase involved in cell wall biosynthesis
MKSSVEGQVTACLVVYNEEKIIRRCLESIKRVTNTIIVVHDGLCSDNTVNICSTLGCKVFIREHVGMCEGHRAWLYSQAKTPWILQIDADEFLSDELIKDFSILINDSSVACYELLWKYWDGKRHRTKNWPFKKALFQRSLVQYLGFPHEEVRPNGLIKKSYYAIEHRPIYDNYSFTTFRKKHMKWIKIHAHFYLRDKCELEYFPEEIDHIKPHYEKIRSYPLLLAPLVFFYHFCGLMINGGIREGKTGIRNSFMQSLYYFFLCLEVKKQKMSWDV